MKAWWHVGHGSMWGMRLVARGHGGMEAWRLEGLEAWGATSHKGVQRVAILASSEACVASTMASTPTKQSSLAWSFRRGSTESLEDERLEDESIPNKFAEESPFKKQRSVLSPNQFRAFQEEIDAARQQQAQELVVLEASKDWWLGDLEAWGLGGFGLVAW